MSQNSLANWRSQALKSQIRGTFILRRKGRSYKVITARHAGDNRWTFQCRGLESKQNQVFEYEMLGMLEAMDAAASKLKDPRDILLIDFDNKGRWVIATKDQIKKIRSRHSQP